MTQLLIVTGVLASLLVSVVACAEDGITENTIVLGQSCALQGPAAALGKGMRDGLSAYFSRVNAIGGIHGRTIELQSVDDGHEPAETERVTRTLIERGKVFCLIGEVGTPTSRAAASIAEASQVPFIGPFTGAEFLRYPHRRYVINLRAGFDQEMERLAQLLVDERGLWRVACFYQNDGYGRAGLTSIKRALERRGLSLCSTGTYQRQGMAVAAGLGSVAAGQPDAVVMVGTAGPCARFVRAAKSQQATQDAVFCTISSVHERALLEELGDAGEGCIVTQVVPYPWDTGIPVIADYHADVRQAGSEIEIGFTSLEGYLVGKLFCSVMEQVGSNPTREAFVEALHATGTFDLGGIVLQFGADDHQGMDEVFLTHVVDGEVVPLVQLAD